MVGFSALHYNVIESRDVHGTISKTQKCTCVSNSIAISITVPFHYCEQGHYHRHMPEAYKGFHSGS